MEADKMRDNKKCRNNLALIRKFAYNILRLAQNAKEGADVMTEMMDFFCDDPSLMQNMYLRRGESNFGKNNHSRLTVYEDTANWMESDKNSQSIAISDLALASYLSR